MILALAITTIIIQGLYMKGNNSIYKKTEAGFTVNFLNALTPIAWFYIAYHVIVKFDL